MSDSIEETAARAGFEALRAYAFVSGGDVLPQWKKAKQEERDRFMIDVSSIAAGGSLAASALPAEVVILMAVVRAVLGMRPAPLDVVVTKQEPTMPLPEETP
ncbi:MAG TPA: hypothetical protein ENH33_00580 [Actinobacteria bacterium]|nr:hypothetical protein [Actinomycetota bacterium]